ncbi:large conductance mechanosensitive channel protein MscL [Aggregatimonas sangjinii]|uniref:Large-conductance mechanosensitive channel n=1 Tax=Aggregatimonas sangjinii TaxID=2583587 RepID=A0A5B7STB2_9FLAO|nr:large conductance mechanosensitive channel protein MscL [Aggregatimonas sangjinii]QCX02015.1 large conductance mechanosensitive channel protein MscL [Aggregatimonas sangjinii]
MLKEFKDFIMTGNVIEFAVAVIMAGAVGAVVNGFVSDIVMPIVGFFSGGVNFDNLFYILGDGEFASLAAAEEAGAAVIAWGRWVNTIVSLVIIGLVMFIIIKGYNKMRAPEPEPAPAGPTAEELLAEIRDELKKS